MTRYKALKIFHIAACSLIYAGFFSVSSSDWLSLAILSFCSICGIFFVYRFNDHVDQSRGFRMNLRAFFSEPLNFLFTLLFFILVFPLSLKFLSAFRFQVLALAGLLGILYSVKFTLFNRAYRLKHAFILKNVAIGLAWGALVLIGADTYADPSAKALFYFVSIQVFIGSAIRDIPDLVKDRREGVQSLAVVMGIQPAISFLHLVNVASVCTFRWVPESPGFLWIIIVTIAWRYFSLREISHRRHLKRWTQSYNLMTCLLIFVLVFLKHLYGIFT